MCSIYPRKPNTHCLICKKEIYRRPAQLRLGSGKVFCSIRCYGISCRREVACVMCGKLILGGLHKKTCSRSCANRNRTGLGYKIGRPRDKARLLSDVRERLGLLRGRACERCGYGTFEVLQVHHKNRNRKDNRPENLELVCPNCHFEEHYLQRK